MRDAVRARPLAGAEVLLTLDGQVRRAETDAHGQFAIEELAPGPWQVRVAAPGHVSEQLTLTIPHRGELRGAHVDLVPVRERIFTLYRRAALPILPSPDLWGIWSPRQIVDHVRGAGRPVRMAELTAFVAEACFSARGPDETDGADIIVIGNGDPEFRAVPGVTRSDQHLVDLVRVGGTETAGGSYDGICW